MSEPSHSRALHPEPGINSLAGLLENIFHAWTASGVRFLILRNYENLPHETGNDVDVLVSPSQAGQAEKVMVEAARTSGYLLHNRVEFATLSCFFYHPQTLRQIQIDLFSTLKWHTFELLSADDLLNSRIPRGSFFTPEPVHEAVSNLLTRLIYQGIVKEKYRASIIAGFQKDPHQARRVLENPFGEKLAGELITGALAGDWTRLESRWRRLQFALISRRVLLQPVPTAKRMVGDFVRLARRWLRPPGMMIAVLGADGSGKSTVSTRVLENLRNTFNPAKGLQAHWKPVVFFRSRRKPTGKPTVNPHGKEPRNAPASLVFLFGHWLEYLLGFYLQFRPVLFKNGLVLVDRYYYDFFVDPLRYRLRTSASLIRLLFLPIKKPDLVFLLDAPAEILQARKQEVPVEETVRQVTEYRRLVESLPEGIVLDASRPVENVATEMTSHILRWMHRRSLKNGSTPSTQA